jgi:hypothetical protein
MRERLLGAVLSLSLGVSATAQSITTIVKAGDNIAGYGNVTVVNGLGVDDQGHAFVHVITDNPNLNTNAAFVDENRAVIVGEGQAVGQPSGAVIRSFNGGVIDVSASGNPAFLLGLLNAPFDEGLYLGTNPDLGLGKYSTSTAAQLTPGSTYQILLPPLINDSKQLCFHCVVDDPGVTGTYDVDALAVLDTTTASQSALYKEGDILSGQTWGIKKFNWNARGMAFNNSGQILFGAEIFAGSGSQVLYLNDTKIAQTGDPSPWGSTYQSVSTSTTAVDLNNNGDYVFSCDVNELFADDGIVRNGEAFVRKSDFLPDIDPFKISELGQALFIGDDGRVLWMGLWDTPAPIQSRGLFIDYTLLVEEGVTQINGLPVTALPGLDRSFTLSPSGQYVLFEATLQGGIEGAFLIDLWQ